ncbi:MAG: enterotoxin [Acidobacteriota bacterium]|nr:enterotoxin [Acidobacteriota bacterium]
MLKQSWSALLMLCTCAAAWAAGPGNHSGETTATQSGDRYALANGAILAEWTLRNGHAGSLCVRESMRGLRRCLSEPFAVILRDGQVYDASALQATAPAKQMRLTPQVDASRLAEHEGGMEFDVPLESADRSLRADWSVILRDGSNYVRQRLTLTAVGSHVAIRSVKLIDAELPGAHVSGVVAGSPIVAGNWFLGVEDPLSTSRVTGSCVTQRRATAWVDRELPLRAGQQVSYSAVIGVAREGQMRRDFLAYLERERAHPYRTFLHYNSWLDLGLFTPYNEAEALDRMHAFERELVEKRGVKMESFLFDDGWDEHHSLWQFNSGFSDGFTAVRKAAEQAGAEPGVWMSPWGGYATPKKERIEFGRLQGYEVVDGGYALSGPRYYDAFRDVCLRMIREYGVNQFKFDGTGNADSVFPGSRFDSDFAAMMHLIGELRAARPDIYINLTTGTWPSPFWLLYADSIWRGGDDSATEGVGTTRERWITYRDADTYRRVVQGGPLYPLNSLMLHGIIYARFQKGLDSDSGNDFRNEVRSYFGTGTQLQELYITPSLLTHANWDDLAEAANWSRANADVLKDTHWVGGDPGWLEVYGWASWAPRKGILVLRNPSDKAQAITLRLADAFELPPDAAREYAARSPWKEDAGKAAERMNTDEPHRYTLAPFEVRTLEMMPVEGAKR